jgi:hypothetical protein
MKFTTHLLLCMGVKLGLPLREEQTEDVWEQCAKENIWNEAIKRVEKLRNDHLHNLYFSPNIIRMIKLRRIRRVGHVLGMGNGKCVIKFGWKAWREETTRKTQA